MSKLPVTSHLRSPTVKNDGLVTTALGLVIAALVIGFLHFGKEAFEPLVIAALLSFILAPPIRLLRSWGLGKLLSVFVVVMITVGALGGLAYIMVLQVTQLAEQLPSHETNLRAKLLALKGTSLSSTALERASDTLRKLEDEISKPKLDKSPVAPNFSVEAQKKGPDPILVEVRPPQQKTLESLQRLLQPLVSPLATTGLIILFLLFILMQREDLRDRMLRLFGSTDLRGSTEAMNDAAARLSRLFIAQAGLNAAFGMVIGTVLGLIGVPNPILWGILAGVMRFVPYIGAAISAVFPIALGAAVDPGWTMVGATAALYVVSEVVAGQIIEPMLFGHHTGMSPVAIVVATLFWTLLWGPIGLLLATPLTVCLVVLGKHIDALEFVEVLLGDEPALTPEENFYQRMLVGDANEAADNAEELLKTVSLSIFYSSVAMKGLSLAQTDASRGKLDDEKQSHIGATVQELVDDLSNYKDILPSDTQEGVAVTGIISREELPVAWQTGTPILCVAGRSALDEAACIMLAHVLTSHGLATRVQGSLSISDRLSDEITTDTKVVCISYFGGANSPILVRYLIRRLRRIMPTAVYIAAFWSLKPDSGKLEEWRKNVGADFVATSLEEAARLCVNVAKKESHPIAEQPSLPRMKGTEVIAPNI